MVSIEYLCGLTLFLSVNLIFDVSITLSNSIAGAVGVTAVAGCLVTASRWCRKVLLATGSCAAVPDRAATSIAAAHKKQWVNLAVSAALLDVCPVMSGKVSPFAST